MRVLQYWDVSERNNNFVDVTQASNIDRLAVLEHLDNNFPFICDFLQHLYNKIAAFVFCNLLQHFVLEAFPILKSNVSLKWSSSVENGQTECQKNRVHE